MTVRQLLGFLLGGVGVWLMFHAGLGMKAFLDAEGGARSLQEALLEPKYALRLLASLGAFVAGLAALTERRGGAWLAAISAFIFGLSVFGLIANRSEVAHWRQEAITLAALTGLFLALVVSTRRTASQGASVEEADDPTDAKVG